MATVFSRTLRSLNADSFRSSLIGLLLAGTVLGGWAAWLFVAEIGVYEVSDTARLIAKRAVHPIEGPLIGQVVVNGLALDKKVQANEILVELAAQEFRIQQDEQQAHNAALWAERDKIHDEIEAEQDAQQKLRLTTRAVLEEAGARYREAKAVYQIAKEEANRYSRLHSKAYLSDITYLKAQAKAQQQKAAVAVQRLAAKRLELLQQTKEADRKARIAGLKREMTQLNGQLKTGAIKIEKLQYEIERRRIRAPIAGHIAEIADLEMGTFVDEGDRLGAIVPAGGLKMVGYFLPSAALGRIKTGQRARLRVKGFPWTQYGTIPATVARVGREVRDGKIRVELNLQRNSHSLIPVQHGLPGTIEIEAERVSPATLLIRIVGRFLTA